MAKLRDALSKMKVDDMAGMASIMDDADKIEADLTTANGIIAEKDAKIAELQEQANSLYARLLTLTTGTDVQPAGEDEHEMTDDEAKEEFLNEFFADEKKEE